MRCEGWTRQGGAFTFGPARWYQCKNDAITMLTVKQGDGTQTLPSCEKCWKRCKAHDNIDIVKAEPLTPETDSKET